MKGKKSMILEITEQPLTGSCLPPAWLQGGSFNESRFIDWLCGEPSEEEIAAVTADPTHDDQ